MKIFDKIAKYYLKDNGTIIYAFVPWTQKQLEDSTTLPKDTYDKLLAM